MGSINPASGPKLLTKQRAALELLFAGALWGFGFVATTWSLQLFSPAELLAYRFVIAFLVGEGIYFLLRRGRFHAPTKSDLIYSLGAGFLLGGLLVLQTVGLQYTTATNSGFITTLYVIFVPVFSHLIFKHEVTAVLYFYVLVALLGMLLLVGLDIHHLNKGDLWTLACSFVAAFHILYIGKVSPRVQDSFRFNNLQSLGALVFLAPLLLQQEHFHLQFDFSRAWGGVLMLALGSSLIGFFIQIRSQKVLSNTTASMLFLLESPFAFLFGFLLLGERLNGKQFLGACLIILASILTIRWEQTSTTKKKPSR